MLSQTYMNRVQCSATYSTSAEQQLLEKNKCGNYLLPWKGPQTVQNAFTEQNRTFQLYFRQQMSTSKHNLRRVVQKAATKAPAFSNNPMCQPIYVTLHIITEERFCDGSFSQTIAQCFIRRQAQSLSLLQHSPGTLLRTQCSGSNPILNQQEKILAKLLMQLDREMKGLYSVTAGF